MFKFKIPTRIIISPSSLTLLALGSLLFIGSTVHTSDIQPAQDDSFRANYQSSLEHPFSDSNINNESAKAAGNVSTDGRRRGGRLYNQSGYGGQQQASMDSYAAAYAAANSPSSPESAQDLVQTSVAANDAASYASFGEPAPSSGSSPVASSAARQLPTSDYSPHASYYSSYMAPSSNSASYSGQPSSASYHSQAYHAYPHYSAKESRPMGYPTNGGYDRHAASNYYDRSSFLGPSSMGPIWASGGPSSGGLMSSASTALSSWTSGFSIGEIICGLIAISIGAVILGAPFFLIYLALMGNFSGSGTLSLTNPTGGAAPAGAATTTVNGRRKRLAIFEQLTSSVNQGTGSEFGSFAESIANQLSPFVDIQQVAATFKRLINSIDKYSNLKPEANKRKTS